MRAIAAAALCAAIASSLTTTTWARDGEIRFAKGATSTTVKSTWNGSTKTHVFRARAGQLMVLHLNEGSETTNPLVLTVYSYCGQETGQPMVDYAVRFEATLPCTGRYSVDIAPPRDAAVAKGALNYKLLVSIK